MELDIWTRVGMLAVVALSVVASLFLGAAQFPQEALVFFGIWLLFYRVLIRSRWGPIVQIMTSAISGASLVLLAPLLAWPSVAYRFPVLALLGGLFAACSFRVSLVVACSVIGIAWTALMWPLGLCKMFGTGPAAILPMSHGHVLLGGAALFVLVFTYSALAANALERVLFPTLGALLFVQGLGSRVGLLSPALLLDSDACPGAELPRADPATALAWLLLAVSGMAFQRFMLQAPEADEDGKEKGTMVECLLPGGSATSAGIQGVIGDKNAEMGGNMERQPVLCTAIFAPEGTDQSHLTAHEKKIVAICRKDEFERDRILFGGGLI